MNLSDIKMDLEFLESISYDDESAHGFEDDLRDRFIKFIAEEGESKFSKMAKEVLKTSDIKFSRWCA
jgi:hypothetical protein